MIFYDKCTALHRRKENFTPCTFLAVIDYRILIRISRRDLRMPGCKACPYLTSDKCTAAVSVCIIDVSGQRRQKRGPQICLSHAILYPVRNYIRKPVFSENVTVHGPSELFNGIEPYKLKIKIIICRRTHGQILCIERDFVDLSLAFKRCSESSADVLTHVASFYPVSQFTDLKSCFDLFHDAVSYVTGFHVLCCNL